MSVLAVLGFAPSLLIATTLKDRRVICNLVVSSLISAAGFLVTAKIIPVLKPAMLRANLFGMDINKKGRFPLCTTRPSKLKASGHTNFEICGGSTSS